MKDYLASEPEHHFNRCARPARTRRAPRPALTAPPRVPQSALHQDGADDRPLKWLCLCGSIIESRTFAPTATPLWRVGRRRRAQPRAAGSPRSPRAAVSVIARLAACTAIVANFSWSCGSSAVRLLFAVPLA